ncbi:MAG: HD domain-containing protein [Pseudomonadota bacterium]
MAEDATPHGGTEATALTEVARALAFVAEAHKNQRRKGAAQEPYINHLVEVMHLVACATGGRDPELMIAALMHDVVEDTGTTPEGLAEAFGTRVAAIVAEVSDDMNTPKEERRRHRLASMPHKSLEARLVKTADVISNLRAVALSPPAGWTAERRLSYLEDCRALIAAGNTSNAFFDDCFGETCAGVERAIRSGEALEYDDIAHVRQHLEGVIGQQVHLVYLANTQRRDLGEAAIDKLCKTCSQHFPSVTVQEAQAVYDGLRRPVLIARIRSDDTDAIVGLAQRLCLVFDERFVGIEVGGRYIRVYADDTG